MHKYTLLNEAATLELATKIAKFIPKHFSIYLSGDLGAGKTTFVRGLLQALGHKGNVKSPTYTLVESYHLNEYQIFHFDLYRVHDTEELELIGIRDYFSKDAIILLEWPEKAENFLPLPDLSCYIHAHQTGGRSIEIKALSQQAQAIINKVMEK